MKKAILSLSFFSFLLGLSIIYFQEINLKPIEVKKVSDELLGKEVIFEGEIVKKFYSKKGNLFIFVSNENSTIEIPLFSRNLFLFNKTFLDDLEVGEKIKVRGILKKYKGIFQIFVRRDKDIKIL